MKREDGRGSAFSNNGDKAELHVGLLTRERRVWPHTSVKKMGDLVQWKERATSVHFLVIAARGSTFFGTWRHVSVRLQLPSPHFCVHPAQWLELAWI